MRSHTLICAVNIVAILMMVAASGDAAGADEMIAVGEPFVDFELDAHDGTKVSSGDLAGSPYLLFFYPKADTPG